MPLVRIADLNGPPDEVVRRIEQARKLSAMYDDFIILEQEGSDRAPGIHASELYPCLRRPVYSCTNVPRKPLVPKFWMQRFKVGTAIHDMLQSDFERMAKRSGRRRAMRLASKVADELDCYFEFEKEIEVSPELQELARYYDLHSHCDGIFTFKDKETDEVVLRVGLEIKSKAPDLYEKLREPEEDHVRQAHVYMAVLDLPLMWFFYINKGNQNNTPSSYPYLTTFQPKIWKEIEERCQLIQQLVAAGTMPDRTEGIWCEFCPWAYTCHPQNAMKAMQRRDTAGGRRNLLRFP